MPSGTCHPQPPHPPAVSAITVTPNSPPAVCRHLLCSGNRKVASTWVQQQRVPITHESQTSFLYQWPTILTGLGSFPVLTRQTEVMAKAHSRKRALRAQPSQPAGRQASLRLSASPCPVCDSLRSAHRISLLAKVSICTPFQGGTCGLRCWPHTLGPCAASGTPSVKSKRGTGRNKRKEIDMPGSEVHQDASQTTAPATEGGAQMGFYAVTLCQRPSPGGSTERTGRRNCR